MKCRIKAVSSHRLSKDSGRGAESIKNRRQVANDYPSPKTGSMNGLEIAARHMTVTRFAFFLQVDNPLSPHHVSLMKMLRHYFAPLLLLILLTGGADTWARATRENVDDAFSGKVQTHEVADYAIVTVLVVCVFLGVGMALGIITHRHPIHTLLLSLLGPIGWIIILLHKPKVKITGSRRHRQSESGQHLPVLPTEKITKPIAVLQREKKM